MNIPIKTQIHSSDLNTQYTLPKDLKLDHVFVLPIYFKVQHGIPSIFHSVHEKNKAQ